MVDIMLLGALVAAAGISIAAWGEIVRRVSRGHEIVPHQPRSRAPWGLADFGFAFALWLTLGLAAHLLLRAMGLAAEPGQDLPGAREQFFLVLLQMLATLAAAAISVALLALRYDVTLRELGIDLSRLGSDVRLGGIAFLVLAPPTYLLQFTLVQFVESKHPIMELLADDRDPWLIAVCAVSAVLVAPLVEEYFFRGLLLGALERLAEKIPHPAAGETGDRRPWWPVWVSALFFALMHVLHGPDWIPLLFLAVGLGYLYRQTQRLVPCIVVHFLLNAMSFSMFVLSMGGGQR